MGRELRQHWGLDPDVTFLNHGSFGATPRAVLDAQRAWRDRMEREPVRFMVEDLERALDAARLEAAAFVGADPEGFAFVSNATTGVNTVLASLAHGTIAPGHELLTTDHVYNACRNALHVLAQRTGARVVVAEVPFPSRGPDEVVERVLAAVSERTRLALLDHVTSPTGLVLPVEQLVPLLEQRGIHVLVDAAHTPGMLPLDVTRLGASYITGNFHKWVCAPKGAAFLHVRADRRAAIRPLVISHGTNAVRPGRSRFRLEFDWGGTDDPSAWLCVPDALRFIEGLRPGGWAAHMRLNREGALAARRQLAARLGVPLPCPDSMIGTLATLPLPPAPAGVAPPARGYHTALQERLVAQHRIQVPVLYWPQAPTRWVRTSTQAYNEPAEVERLAGALEAELAAERR
ncbi:MAG: aminotransferase class V-fold PLP-dependent enzyme [Planctomycetia bacterium]